MEKDSHIFKLRHSLAHVLAHAVKDLYPNVKFGTGPAIETGFYYDFDFGSEEKSPNDQDLEKIEQRMRELLKEGFEPTQEIVNLESALARFKDEPYKTEILKQKAENNSDLSIYTIGSFSDPCSGPHVASSKDIDPTGFKLERIAGAYWKGSEENPMLTRIYGLAFENKKELKEHLARIEEAKKRDHRKLGKELDLFTFSETVGKGLPLYTPKGSIIRRELEQFIIKEESKRGYQHVYTPDIARLELYKKSGHYPHYKDSMYAPIKIDDEEFMLRPMTCPHHYELFLSKPRSYKELPMRIAELAQLYRYEQSGELSGLIRVRTFCLADAHIICKDEEEAIQEISGALDLIEFVAHTFGLEMKDNYWYRLSLGNREDTEKYYKDDAAWDKGETMLRDLLKKRNSHFVEAEDEAAFYGPKIDVQMRNVNGKEDTAFTVQYDFCMPERFNLTYTGDDGTEKRALVVHRSSIGAIERIMAFLIEHYSGNFPLWLSPEQLRIIPVSDVHNDYAKKVLEELTAVGIRVTLDDSKESMGKKIRNAKMDKLPYFAVIGDREVEEKNVTLESRRGESKQLTLSALANHLLAEIDTKAIS